jgi:phosphoribosyl-ATP pyrophosphohydrolase
MTEAFTLDALAQLIAARAISSSDQSYTRSLLDSGTARVAKKFGEEAFEAAIAAVEHDREGLKLEAADVLYHLLVLLQDGGVPLQDVIDELSWRTRQSGHQEKASRAK